MKRRRRSESEIIQLLGNASVALSSGTSIAGFCESIGVSEATFHRWRKRYGGASTANGPHGRCVTAKPDLAARIHELERQNKRLKQLLAELMLENSFLREATREKH